MTNDSKHTGARRAMDKAEDVIGAAVGKVAASVSGGSTSGFVRNAVLGDLYEIEAAELALSRGTQPIRNIAQEMLSEHRQNSQRLISTAKRVESETEVPSDLDERRRGMIDNLRTAPDDEFEKVFVQQQKAAHEEALDLYRTYAEEGESEPLREFAGQTLPVLKRHLKHVHGLTAGR